MTLNTEQNRIFTQSEAGTLLAEITFPATGENTVCIDHTFVDGSLRGQGVAGQLMEAAVAALRATDRKAAASCSYAQRWFSEHPETADIQL